MTPQDQLSASLARAAAASAIAFAVSSCWRVAARLSVFAGCAHLVFWRDQTGWLFLGALVLVKFIR